MKNATTGALIIAAWFPGRAVCDTPAAGVALPEAPARVMLMAGECASTVTGTHQLRWFCAQAADGTDQGVAIPASPQRVMLGPGECAATVTGDDRLRWFCSYNTADPEAAPQGAEGASAVTSRSGTSTVPAVASTDPGTAALRAALDDARRTIAELRETLARADCAASRVGAAASADPVPVDTDQDGVGDDADLCAATAPGTVVDSSGCTAGHEIVLPAVQFSLGSAELQPDARMALDETATRLRRHPDLRFEVGGHTDDIGSAEVNLEISARRADAVRDYLVAHGVAARQLSARGYGDRLPIAENTTAAGRARNRRVTLSRLP